MSNIERDLNRRKAIRDTLQEAERERDHWADATMRLGEENTELRRRLAGAVSERDWLARFAAQARGWTVEKVEAAMRRDLAARTPSRGQ